MNKVGGIVVKRGSPPGWLSQEGEVKEGEVERL